jgi:hypothetical protein
MPAEVQGPPTAAATASSLSHASQAAPARHCRPHVLGRFCRKCAGSGHEGHARPCRSCGGDGWVFTAAEQAIMAARGF